VILGLILTLGLNDIEGVGDGIRGHTWVFPYIILETWLVPNFTSDMYEIPNLASSIILYYNV
jgi:hypothetical protein